MSCQLDLLLLMLLFNWVCLCGCVCVCEGVVMVPEGRKEEKTTREKGGKLNFLLCVVHHVWICKLQQCKMKFEKVRLEGESFDLKLYL